MSRPDDQRAPAAHTGLPAPPPVAQAHSATVAATLAAAIDAAGGWLDFAQYLDLVLYAPGLGYYSAGATRFGPAGDFVTAPELGSAFAGCVARVARRLAATLPDSVIVEFGAGSGALAADVLAALADAPPARYLIVEVSADLRARQRDLLASRVPALLDRVAWLDRLPPTPVDGLIVANEVIDALPFARFALRDGALAELGVERRAEGFAWAARPAGAGLAAAVGATGVVAGDPAFAHYTSEVRPRADAWVAAVAGCLGRGLALLVDYGGTAREVYHPSRSAGTLRCHYRHHAHDDPFFWPGLQDITAWVDFSQVARAARAGGLAVAAYGTQAHFLLATGVLESPPAGDPAARARSAHELGRLLLPGELGERFKVLVLGRDAPAWAAGLVMRDLSAALA